MTDVRLGRSTGEELKVSIIRPLMLQSPTLELADGSFVPTTDIANRYICALWGWKLMTAIRAIRTKMASTAACATAKGGSVCVGANALRAETFPKLCATKTKTLS